MKKEINLFQDNQTPEEQDQQLKIALGEVFKYDLKNEFAKELKDEYKIAKSDPKKESAKIKSISMQSSNKKWMMVAASLIFFVGAYFVFNLSNLNNNLEQYAFAEKITHPGIQKGANVLEDLSLAVKAFNEGDWEKAGLLFGAMDNANDESNFYAGLSYFYKKDYTEALSYFKVIDTNKSTYSQETRWFIGLSYLLNGNETKGKEFLKLIKQQDWKYKEASLLLNK